jgi:integrase
MLMVTCRKNELVTARREQYNPFTDTIYIPDTKADIPVNKPVPPEMDSYFKAIPEGCPWLFYEETAPGKYRPLTHLRYAWKYCLEKAGIADMRIHDLRHISATDLYAAGVPERVIMDTAGWKTPMLSRYRHADSLKSAQNIRAMWGAESEIGNAKLATSC